MPRIFGAMLVATVERFISATDERLAPLNQRGRKKTGDHANNDLLQKSSVHGVLRARAMPSSHQKPH